MTTYGTNFNEKSDDMSPKEISSEEEKDEDVNKSSKSEKWIFGSVLSFVNFSFGLLLSLYGPIFPQLAKEKKLPLWLYSLIFSASYVSTLIFIPLVTLESHRHIKQKLLLFTGAFVVGSCGILFGSLQWCPVGVYFVILAILIRILEGFGTSLILLSSYAIINFKFQSDAWKIFLWLESFKCTGFIIGSIAGVVMFEVYNFSLPFLTFGGLTIIASVCVISILTEPAQGNVNLNWNFFPLLKNFCNLTYFFSLFATSVYSGFLETILQPFLNQFNLQGVFLGLLFSASIAGYLIAAPGWNWLNVKGFNGVMLIVICELLVVCSSFLIGPVSFLHFETSLSFIISALLLKGIGEGGQFVCSITSSFNDMVAKNYANDITTRFLIFEMFVFCISIGRFIGSSISGIIYETLKFRKSTLIFFGLEILPIPFLIVHAFKRNYRKLVHLAATPDEVTSIIPSTSNS